MLFDRVKELCQKRGISVSELENRVGFGKNTIYKWKTQSPKVETLQKVADYFNVTTDYLLGRETENLKNETDLSKMLDDVLSFDGKPMTEHDREVIKAFLEGKFANK